MDIYFFIQFILVLILLVISGFFSSSETALFSLTDTQLDDMRRRGNTRYSLLIGLLNRPRKLIVTILLGNEFTNLLLSTICATLIINAFGEDKSYYNLLLATPLLLLFGEITPKALAVRHNLAFALFNAPLLQLFTRLVAPLRIVVRIASDRITTWLVGNPTQAENLLSEDMVLTLAKEAAGDGVLDQDEVHYIHQIFKFGDATIDDAMVSRSNMIFISQDTTPSQVIKHIKETDRDKMVICRENQDDVIGLLFARDLTNIDINRKRSKTWLLNLARKPILVPATKPLMELFQQLRSQKISMALVIDEYGGIIGQISIRDILDFIFDHTPLPKKVSKKGHIKKTRLAGSMLITKFNSRFDTRLSTEHGETLNGLLIHHHGELPPRKMCIIIEGIQFTIQKIKNNRIEEIYVQTENINHKKILASIYSKEFQQNNSSTKKDKSKVQKKSLSATKNKT